MLTIEKKEEGKSLTLLPTGRIDTVTAPDLEKEVKEYSEGKEELVMDLAGLEYISSAGLRVLLAAHKSMIKQNGKMVIRNVSEAVKDIFEVTGFADILNFEG